MDWVISPGVFHCISGLMLKVQTFHILHALELDVILLSALIAQV